MRLLHTTDKNQPTVCDVRLGRDDITIVGTTLSAVIVLIIIVAIIIIITLAHHSRKIAKEGTDCVNHTVQEGMQTLETNIREGNAQILETVKDVVKILAEFSENRPTPSTQTGRTENDGGSAALVELVSVEDLEELISFVSDALSAALENPQICNKMKNNVDSIIRRYWKDIETG